MKLVPSRYHFLFSSQSRRKTSPLRTLKRADMSKFEIHKIGRITKTTTLWEVKNALLLIFKNILAAIPCCHRLIYSRIYVCTSNMVLFNDKNGLLYK